MADLLQYVQLKCVLVGWKQSPGRYYNMSYIIDIAGRWLCLNVAYENNLILKGNAMFMRRVHALCLRHQRTSKDPIQQCCNVLQCKSFIIQYKTKLRHLHSKATASTRFARANTLYLPSLQCKGLECSQRREPRTRAS